MNQLRNISEYIGIYRNISEYIGIYRLLRLGVLVCRENQMLQKPSLFSTPGTLNFKMLVVHFV